ncbi:MAG: HD-GYP domain-containing protein [Acidimicrobiia bacterium]|nr:HD-GYP domain-containing protein [Acidimicrobiia bacterium]
MLEGMLERMWERDEALARHGFRVATFATALAQHLDAPPEMIDRLRIAAMIHDIGKLRLDPLIIAKPGPLNEAEWHEMRKHPEHGFEMVKGYVHPDICGVLLAHHERYDGVGYPFNRAGTDIPRGARILLVADAFDAMTSDRPYQPPMPIADALRELEENAGSQFDPNVVEAMLDLSANGRLRTAHAVKISA